MELGVGVRGELEWGVRGLGGGVMRIRGRVKGGSDGSSRDTLFRGRGV